MKRDIRDLFKQEEGLKTLPQNHRIEFLAKLKKQPKHKPNMFFWMRTAAIVVIALTVGSGVYYNKLNNESASTMIAQIEAVEAEYLKDIEKEWKNFLSIANDEVLVARFKKKLDELDSDYKEISIQFKNDTNNILVIEALVDNLQTRLQILRDIQEHIKILNQKSEHYEKSI